MYYLIYLLIYKIKCSLENQGWQLSNVYSHDNAFNKLYYLYFSILGIVFINYNTYYYNYIMKIIAILIIKNVKFKMYYYKTCVNLYIRYIYKGNIDII